MTNLVSAERISVMHSGVAPTFITSAEIRGWPPRKENKRGRKGGSERHEMPLSGPSVFIVGRVTASRVESFMLIGEDRAFMTPRRKISIPGALPKKVDPDMAFA